MGLFMYAAILEAKPATEVNCPLQGYQLLHTWDKHPNLHGWMKRLYHAKGGLDEHFCASTLHLTPDDLDALETDVLFRKLPFTQGAFFGWSDGREQGDDLAFIAHARAAITAGFYIVYAATW